MPEFRNVVREHRFPASVRHRGPGRRPQRDGISVSGLTQKPRLLEAPHRRDLCHLHASQTGGQHVAVLTVNHDDNTQTSHRLHAIHPTRVPAAKLTRRSAAGGTGTSFFFQYYLRLHRLRRLQRANHPMVKLRTRMSYLCTGVDVLVVCCGRACRGTQLQHRASPHQWT
jgi:hypothetical protein